MRLLADPDNTDHGIEQVIHYHAPSCHIAQSGIDFLSYIGERRTGAGISTRHASIADCGKEHGDNGDEDWGHHVSAAAIAEHPKHRHGSHWLNHDHAIENQIPKSKCAAQARRRRHCSGGNSFHGCAYWIMPRAKLSILKRFCSRILNSRSCAVGWRKLGCGVHARASIAQVSLRCLMTACKGEAKARHISVDALVLAVGDLIGFVPYANAAVRSDVLVERLPCRKMCGIARLCVGDEMVEATPVLRDHGASPINGSMAGEESERRVGRELL